MPVSLPVSRRRWVPGLCALGLAASACATSSPGSSAPARAAQPATGPRGVSLVAAGDLACSPRARRTALRCHHRATSDLALRLRPARVALLGDTQYDRGTLAEFRASFQPTWGRLKSRSRPAVGNHEYLTPGASGYFTYFGAAAGPRGRGYYSYDLGGWHVVVLNSNCEKVSCAPGSAQERWLRADLAAHRATCTLAYWHHPRFSSGFNGNFANTAPFWRALHAAGADVVLTGHDHDYERFAPQAPLGRADPARGIRQFGVGTGGELLRPFRAIQPNSQRRAASTFGVLALTLRPTGYSWRFVPEPGRTFTDSGSGRCH